MSESSKKLKLDFFEFQTALEGFETMGSPISHFLDTETGEILSRCEDWEDYDELSERIDAGVGERYRCIEPLEPHESFRIMKDFAGSLPESELKARLCDALSRNKPFRRFKDVVHSDLALRQQWFHFRDDAYEQYARDWLEANGIEGELQRQKT
jgi:hypothetical protein